MRLKCAAFSASVVGFSSMQAMPPSVSSQARRFASVQIARTWLPGSQAGPRSNENGRRAVAKPLRSCRPKRRRWVPGEGGHGLVGNAVGTVEAVPPVLAVGHIETTGGGDPDLADAVGGDRDHVRAGLDRRLARLELPGPTSSGSNRSPAERKDPGSSQPRSGRWPTWPRRAPSPRGQFVPGDEVDRVRGWARSAGRCVPTGYCVAVSWG